MSSVYVADLDNVIAGRYDRYESSKYLRAKLIINALLWDRLVVNDLHVLNNDLFHDLLRASVRRLGFEEMLKDGVIAVTRRPEAQSFVRLNEWQHESGTYTFRDRSYLDSIAEHLDAIVTERVDYDHSSVYDDYTRIVFACLRDDSLAQLLGLSPAVRRGALEGLETTKGQTGQIRRTSIYRISDHLTWASDAERDSLRELGDVALHLAFSNGLRANPSYPRHVQTALGAVHGVKLPHEPNIVTDWTNYRRYEELSPLPIGIEDLAAFSYDDVKAIRSSKPFRTYMDGVRAAQQRAAEDPYTAANMFSVTLTEYLFDIGGTLVATAAGRRRSFEYRQRMRTFVTKVNYVGGSLVTLAGAPAGESAGIFFIMAGLAWIFGARRVEILADQQYRKELSKAFGDQLITKGLDGRRLIVQSTHPRASLPDGETRRPR